MLMMEAVTRAICPKREEESEGMGECDDWREGKRRRRHLGIEDEDDGLVHVALDLAHLGGRVAIVHLDLRLLSAIDRHAVSPICVGEERAAEEEVVGPEGDGLFHGVQVEGSNEVVNIFVGRLELQVASEDVLSGDSVLGDDGFDGRGCLLELQIGLTVDVGSLHVALVAIRVERGHEEQHVDRHCAMAIQLHNVACSNLFRRGCQGRREGKERKGREPHILSPDDGLDHPIAFELDDGRLGHILIIVRSDRMR
jgi:hypothetical protein